MPTPPLATPWVPLWPLQAAGPTLGPLTLLADVTISTPTNIGAQINLPSGLKSLLIYVTGRSSAGVADDLAIQFNNDGAANYDNQIDSSIGTTANGSVAFENLNYTYAIIGRVPGTGAAAGFSGMTVVEVPHPSSGFYKNIVAHGGFQDSGGSPQATRRHTARWRNTAPITSILVATAAGQFIAGSRITVYGVGDTIIQPAGIVTPVTIGTTLPASPADGQEAILVDSLTAPTYQWLFKYMAGIADAYKWVYIGGAEQMKSIEPQQSIASATYGDLATVGPTVVIPRAGYYNVGLGCESYSGNAGENGIMSYSIGATAAVDADGMVGLNFNVVNYLSRRVGLKLFATGGISLVAKYRCNNGASTNFYAKRHLSVIPVRVA